MESLNWKEILSPYSLAVKELIVKFNYVIKEHKERGLYSPIERLDGRVKSVSSILEKANRKNIPLREITEQMQDIAGIRLMCQFVDDIYTVVEFIRSRRDMKIESEVDYIASPKSSGYRSYHMVVQYEVQTSFRSYTIPVEIQIRTLAMNFWAITEHSLQYKYAKNIPEDVSKRLITAAEAVYALDSEMSSIRDEILDAQTLFRRKANVVHEVFQTLEQLQKVAAEADLIRLQNRFFDIYNNGDMEELQTFANEIELISKRYISVDISQ